MTKSTTKIGRPEAFLGELAALRFDNVFNPYRDLCDLHDVEDAANIRASNLLMTLEAAQGGIDELWIALEPGHRGARRTGIPMTDDKNLAAHADRWGLKHILRATHSGPQTEQTASVVWQGLEGNNNRIFLWNIFPLHCHQPGNPLSNRNHSPFERDACAHITKELIAIVAPNQIRAIGQKSADALALAGYPFEQVRHPARGGKNVFLAAVKPDRND
jgi:uracil-DNA glycosylase